MLSQIVFIASFLAVCIRNSESVAEPHIVLTDDQAVDTIQQFPHGVIPILLMQDGDPMATNPALSTFINNEYNHIIIVINKNDLCKHTNKALIEGFDKNLLPALYMMKEGQKVKGRRVTNFRDSKLIVLKNNADTYQLRVRGVTSLSDEIFTNMSNPILQPAQHPGIQMGNPMGNPLEYFVGYQFGNQMGHQFGNPWGPPFGYQMGHPMGNPEEIYRPNYPGIEPQYGTTHNYQGESSSQPGPMLNYQHFDMIRSDQPTLPIEPTPPVQPTLIRPTAVYPERQHIPETQNLLDSMEKQDDEETDTTGGIPQTLQYWHD